jgi:hypothetical protein
MTRLLLGAVAALTLSACFHIRYVQQEPAEPKPAYETWNNTFVFGLLEGNQPHDASRACPGGFAEVKNHQSFLAGFVQLITLSIYAPTDVAIHCVQKRAEPPGAEPGVPVALARWSGGARRPGRWPGPARACLPGEGSRVGLASRFPRP